MRPRVSFLAVLFRASLVLVLDIQALLVFQFQLTRMVVPLTAVAAGCEQTAEAASRQFSSADSAYFRFNVQQGLQVRPNRQFTFAQVSAHSRSYTSTMEVKEKVDRLVQVMKERPCIYAVDLLHRPQTTMIFKVPQRTAESVRLQDATNRLPYAQCAYFDPEGGCLPGTRHTLLSTIRDWLDEQDQACHYRVLLVDGPLGSGKSTLTTTIAKEAKQSGLLASAFFLTAGATTDSSLKQNHASPPSIYNLMSTFIRDLAGLSVLFREAVGAELDTHPALLTASPIDQFQRLLVPFVNLLPDRPMLWVIDGYDELRKDANSTDLAHRLLELFQKDVQALDSRFMILIASRPFRHPWFKGPIAPHVTALHIDLTSPSNEVDMVLIAHAELQQVAQLNESFGPEPEQGHETVGQFATRAGGLPLWLRAARKFIQHSFNPRQDLDDIVATPVPTNCSHQEIMDDLYAMCLKSCFDNWSHVSRREQVGQVVDILLSLQRPMNLSTLLELYEHDKKLSSTVVWNVMESFRPVLLRDTPIDFIHSSFRDFLSSETFLKILTVPSFKGQGSFGHCSLLSRSMFVLQHQLPSIREFLDGSGDLSSESKILSLRNLPATSSAALAYCSGTWTTHFLSTPEIAGDVLKQLHEFLNGSFKRWVEFETFFGVLPIDQQFMKNVLQRFEDEGGRLALFPYLQHQATGTLLHRLAIHLQSSGRFQEASDASELATTIIAPLVQCGDILPKDLATALATLSGSQARLERDQDATRSKGLAVKLSQESKHSDVVNRTC
ncbi:hypothetical protein DL96DRAFT_703793 [Flagelloscypha sp. PMI_526]|nr:hypothetical protein DL96DRAFT_703793 [Flagelloscypha sp. PMI_526]